MEGGDPWAGEKPASIGDCRLENEEHPLGGMGLTWDEEGPADHKGEGIRNCPHSRSLLAAHGGRVARTDRMQQSQVEIRQAAG